MPDWYLTKDGDVNCLAKYEQQDRANKKRARDSCERMDRR